MATTLSNSKGFLIIVDNLHNFQNVCGFGQHCDNCNKLLTKDIIRYTVHNAYHNTKERVVDNSKYYYVAAIDSLLCEDCLNKFLESNDKPTDNESVGFEVRKYERYGKMLGLIKDTTEIKSFNP